MIVLVRIICRAPLVLSAPHLAIDYDDDDDDDYEHAYGNAHQHAHEHEWTLP